MNYSERLVLENVLLVEGLTTNLISIYELCDQSLGVHFTNFKCVFTDANSSVVMIGNRSTNDCYLWVCAINENPRKCILLNLMKLFCGIDV